MTIQSARDLLNLFGMHGELQFEALQVGDLMIRKLSLFPSEEQGFHTVLDQMSKYTELNYLHWMIPRKMEGGAWSSQDK